MAEQLKQSYGLLSLKVALVADGDGGRIQFTIERHRNGRLLLQLCCDQAVKGTGLPEELENGPTRPFDLPERLLSLLPSALADSDPEEPLWLHLVKPYGHLGALPWERLLTAATGHPVLRLPDFLEKPREDGAVLQVAIVCDLKLEDEADARAFEAVQAAWLGVKERDVRIHLFASHHSRRAARRHVVDERVVLHDPADLPPLEDRMEHPWLHWITHALAGKALDAVHLLCPAHVVHGRSSIRLSRPYQRQKNEPVTYVSPSEVSSSLLQAGAWCFVASGPRDRSCDTALRHFVDAMAQIRPGPALFHQFEGRKVRSELVPAFRLLFSAAPHPPHFKDAFLYCQPELVAPEALPVSAPSIVAIDANADLLGSYSHGGAAGAADIPSWFAATQRFVETVELEVRRSASGDVLMRDLIGQTAQSMTSGPSDPDTAETIKAVQDTVDQLQQIVGDFARSYSGEGG